MTNPSGPSGSHEAGSHEASSHGATGESEKKKWGYKREQFDAVITKTRFNGAIERLIAGTVEPKTLLGVLDELNGSSQQGRYMAEMLALKKESRLIGTCSFSPAVAEFLIEGSRRIPVLSDGLASQMAVTLAAAADNLDYLDTVNEAVGNLLLDLDHPLRPDTRNYLRALTDKIDATRRLQQARAHLSTVPSVYPPPSRDLAEMAAGQPSTPKPSPVIAVGEGPPSSVVAVPAHAERAEPSPSVPRPSAEKPTETQRLPELPRFEDPDLEDLGKDSGKQPARDTLANPPPSLQDEETDSQEATQVRRPKEPAPAATPTTPLSKTQVMPTHVERVAQGTPQPSSAVSHPTEVDPDEPQQSEPARTQPGLGKPLPLVSDVGASTPGDVDPSDGGTSEEPLRLPTRRFPLGIVLTIAGIVVAGGVGTYLFVHSRRGPAVSPETSASAMGSVSASPSASAEDARQKRRERAAKRRQKKAPEAAAASAPAAAAQASSPAAAAIPAPPPEPARPPPSHEEPAARPKAPSSPVVVSPPRSTGSPARPRTATRSNGSAPARAGAVPAATAAPAITAKPVASAETPASQAPVQDYPRTPTASKDIDQILAELRQVPGDVAHIEAKAHEVSRIIARSAKSEAEHILGRLSPEELLFGTEAYDTRALEPMRRVVALLLQKVAVDKDDGRAAMAIEMLGDWAESRKHGAAAKLTLDDLAQSPVILTRPRRRLALERVQARLGTAPLPRDAR